MISRIQALPEEVVHLIAAGEVIDSLAAVVRELVENAIDAGATRIAIALWLEQWRVRVADNGAGMSLSDLEQAATPHSTSKIRDSQDLWSIKSLGFRGEALHSLAQLAELEVCSRSLQSAEGWRVRYDHQGTAAQSEVAAIAPGTVVTASHLFRNWVPRRQGLPAPAQQLRAVQQTVQHLALCHPHITWQVEQGDRDWFSIGASETAKQTLPQFLKEVQPSDLQEWEEATHHADLDGKIYLLMGLPDRCHRHRPDWIKVAVNGRMVRVSELEQTILSAFRRTLPRDRFPVCFIHLYISPHQVDWNRNPGKAEIYLHHMEAWREQVIATIDRAMRFNPSSLSESAHLERMGQVLKAAEASGVYGNSRSVSPDSQAVEEQALIPLRAVAQVRNTYIVAEHPGGLWLVEQHIAHERVLYEQLCDRWQLVSLQSPILLQGLFPAQFSQLQRLGLDIEPFGEQVWAIRTAPESLADREDCADALIELSLGGDLQSALVATACRTAIRNGTPLGLPEMQRLLDQWQKARNPRTCPHGRPIYLSLEESSLSRFFRRHWVIGKSHGI